MRRINQEGWIANFNHHIQQFTKGVLVSLFTFAGYGLAKRWLGESHDAPITNSHEQALTIFSQKIPTDVPTTISPSHASSDLPQKSFTVTNSNSRSLRDIPKPSEKSVAEELGISFSEKETVTKEPLEKIIQPTPTYTTNSENSNAENMTIIVGEPFRIKIPGYTVGFDGKTYYFGTMSATLADGSPLPEWMRMEPPAIPVSIPIIGKQEKTAGETLAINGDLAFIASDSGLDIVNIADPHHLYIVGSKDIEQARGIAVQGNLAVVAAGTSDNPVQIVNVTDPQHPAVISVVKDAGNAVRVAIQENIVFVGSATRGLMIINISDAAHPSIIKVKGTGGYDNVVLKKNLAFVQDAGLLEILNITNLTNPITLGKVRIEVMFGEIADIAVQANLVLTASESGGFLLINTTDLYHPTIVGKKNAATAVAMRGNLALVATHPGLLLVNVTNPRAPTTVSTIKIPGYIYSIGWQKTYAFALGDDGLSALDLRAWTWSLVGTPPTAASEFVKVHIQSNQIEDQTYDQTIMLHIYERPCLKPHLQNLSIKPKEALLYRFASEFTDSKDIILPFQSIAFTLLDGSALPPWLTIDYSPQVGNLGLDFADKVTIYNNLALLSIPYCVDEGYGPVLMFVDITDIRQPILIGKLKTPGIVRTIYVYDELAFVAATDLLVINITNPSQPIIVVDFEFEKASIDSLAIQGNLAVVTASSYINGTFTYCLLTIDISNFTHPSLLGALKIDDGSYAIALHNNLAYVPYMMRRDDSLLVINITNPLYPTPIGIIRLASPHDIVIQTNLAFIPTYHGLEIFNITNPKSPFLLGKLELSGSYRLVVQGKVAFVTVNGGVQLVDITDPSFPKKMGKIEVEGRVRDVAVQENFAVFANSKGLQTAKFGLGAGVLSILPGTTSHSKYPILLSARNSLSIPGNGTFWLSINNPPVWKTRIPIRQVYAKQTLSFQLPDDVFYDEDGDALRFNSTLSYGRDLPSWITFFTTEKAQIFIIIPEPNNRGKYNISVYVDDGYFGQAQAWFGLEVPFRKPEKINDIFPSGISLWRFWELSVAPRTIFEDLDVPGGSELSYYAQLVGGDALPSWLQFDNSTCRTKNRCYFSGTPSIADLRAWEVELVARNQGGKESARFIITINFNTLFQDLATYYSISGAGLVVLSLLARFCRWRKMRRIHADLSSHELIVDIGGAQVNAQSVRDTLHSLLLSVEKREIQVVKQRVQAYRQVVLCYVKQQQNRLLEIEDPWVIVEKISKEIGRRVQHRLSYSETLSWIEILHQLLQLIIETEEGYGRAILKTNKEILIDLLAKVEKYIQSNQKHGVQIKHQLQLCREALVSMDDTDSIIDNLCCRDSEMLLEIIKTMVAPPYGIVRLIYMRENIPLGWYPVIIQMFHLAEKALTNSEKLSELQITLSQQKDWRVVYEGVGLLGKVARETEDEKIQKQAVEGIQGQARGLNYYQNYRGFWGRCSPCCDRQSAWIRTHAQAEVKSVDQDAQEVDVGVSMNSLRQPLLQIQA